MNIYITLDYELFFGAKSGSVYHSIIKPTQALLKIVEPLGIKFTCFVDSGYLIQLEKYKETFTELEEDYRLITEQIKYLANNNHGIELHVHPHWEDTIYDGNRWVFDTKRYKLADFSETEVLDIVTRYTEVLKRISGIAPVAYRAGGWSAQPFSSIKKALKANNIFIDSTVYPKGYHNSENQVFDFKEVAQYNTKYNFSESLTREDPNGDFTEIPISSYKVSPLFFWKFVFNKVFKQKKHNALGDGNALPMPRKEQIRLLTKPSNSVVSIDGFKASYLQKAYKVYKKNTTKDSHFVLIGHPKAFSDYSLKKVSKFVKSVHKDNVFVTYKN